MIGIHINLLLLNNVNLGFETKDFQNRAHFTEQSFKVKIV